VVYISSGLTFFVCDLTSGCTFIYVSFVCIHTRIHYGFIVTFSSPYPPDNHVSAITVTAYAFLCIFSHQREPTPTCCIITNVHSGMLYTLSSTREWQDLLKIVLFQMITKHTSCLLSSTLREWNKLIFCGLCSQLICIYKHTRLCSSHARRSHSRLSIILTPIFFHGIAHLSNTLFWNIAVGVLVDGAVGIASFFLTWLLCTWFDLWLIPYVCDIWWRVAAFLDMTHT